MSLTKMQAPFAAHLHDEGDFDPEKAACLLPTNRRNYSASRRFGRFSGAKVRLDRLFEPANAVNRNLREGRLSSYE